MVINAPYRFLNNMGDTHTTKAAMALGITASVSEDRMPDLHYWPRNSRFEDGVGTIEITSSDGVSRKADFHCLTGTARENVDFRLPEPGSSDTSFVTGTIYPYRSAESDAAPESDIGSRAGYISQSSTRSFS